MNQSMLDSSGMQIAVSVVQTNPGGIRQQDTRGKRTPQI